MVYQHPYLIAHEAVTLAGKHQLRRLGLHIGRHHRHEHLNLLFAHYMNKRPGYSEVLRAVRMYRDKARGMSSPKAAFAAPLWKC